MGKEKLKSLQDKIARYRKKIGKVGKQFNKMTIEENISEPVLEQNQESCQVTEEDSEDNDNFTLPTPPYVPLATNKENNHAENDENELQNMEEEANKIKQTKNKKKDQMR